MLGAIIGDIVGSIYEVEEIERRMKHEEIDVLKRRKVLNKRTQLFRPECTYTDDTVLTCAIADAILNEAYFTDEFEEYLRSYGNKELELGLDKFGRSRFSPGFTNWLLGKNFVNSCGNGCAMRISSIPMFYDNINKITAISNNATYTTHCHNESIEAVNAVCLAIFYAKQGKSKEYIKQQIENKTSYKLDFNLSKLQETYEFSSKAKDTVPQAIFCFLKSRNFEDAIRKAISIGGDSDTIASITGAIAENYYGIPLELKNQALKYLPDETTELLVEFYSTLYKKEEKSNQSYINCKSKKRVKTYYGRNN